MWNIMGRGNKGNENLIRERGCPETDGSFLAKKDGIYFNISVYLRNIKGFSKEYMYGDKYKSL